MTTRSELPGVRTYRVVMVASGEIRMLRVRKNTEGPGVLFEAWADHQEHAVTTRSDEWSAVDAMARWQWGEQQREILAPGELSRTELRSLLAALASHELTPHHSHEIPLRWDGTDNPCGKCSLFDVARRVLQIPNDGVRGVSLSDLYLASRIERILRERESHESVNTAPLPPSST